MMLLVPLFVGISVCFPLTDVDEPPSSDVAIKDLQKQGWTPSVNQRGTAGIIWNSLFTLFLCSWSVLCVNCPAMGDTTWTKFRRKLYMAGLCLAGPEFTLQIALSQCLAACESRALFRALGHDQWTMTHGFFVNMGGIVLHSTIGDQGKMWEPFPIDAKQLHYLIEHQCVDENQIKAITKQTIRDKNKVHGVLRGLTALQAGCFFANFVARAAQQLKNTTLELTTVSFIVFSILIQGVWWSKPADIEVPIIIESTKSIDRILLEAGDAAKHPFARTPLDFVSRKEWYWSILWSNGRGYWRSLGFDFGIQGTPYKRFSNTETSEVPGGMYLGFVIIACGCLSTFFAAWDWSFPTPTERLLWRMSCLFLLLAIAVGYMGNTFAFSIWPRIRPRFLRRSSKSTSKEVENVPQQHSNPLVRKWLACLAYARNSTAMKEPELDASLRMISLTWAVGIIYCFGRAYIWLEDFLELRSLPASAYQTVEWGRAIPLLGFL